jgi:hypothetical protein
MLLVALQDVKATAHGLQQYSSIRAIFVESGSGVIAGASNCSLLTGKEPHINSPARRFLQRKEQKCRDQERVGDI